MYRWECLDPRSLLGSQSDQFTLSHGLPIQSTIFDCTKESGHVWSDARVN